LAFSELQVVAESNYWHVSNVTLFGYLDQARKVWYEYCNSFGSQPLVVNVNINYNLEAFDNERLYIRTKIDRVGNSSFTLKQIIFNEQKDPVVTADAIIALIDLQTRQKFSIPSEIRRLMDQDISIN
jgi:acyl-CoA thioesterase FadM